MSVGQIQGFGLGSAARAASAFSLNQTQRTSNALLVGGNRAPDKNIPSKALDQIATFSKQMKSDLSGYFVKV
ncbi:MAG: hypothetical protein V4691_03260 [Pseudomonadota bacterium]